MGKTQIAGNTQVENRRKVDYRKKGSSLKTNAGISSKDKAQGRKKLKYVVCCSWPKGKSNKNKLLLCEMNCVREEKRSANASSEANITLEYPAIFAWYKTLLTLFLLYVHNARAKDEI